jgi:bifunctional non-homologous end joining protein LigD
LFEIYVPFVDVTDAPYSGRPYLGATGSESLRWSDVKKGLDPARFTLLTMPKRIDTLGDLWSPALGPGIHLRACLERLAGAQVDRR